MKSLASSIEKSQYTEGRFSLEVQISNGQKAWVFFTRVVVTNREVEFYDGSRYKMGTFLSESEVAEFCREVDKLGIPRSTEVEDVKNSEAVL